MLIISLTKDSTLSWFAVGDYKKRANIVGGWGTAKPKEVPQQMRELLSDYNAITKVTFEDVVAFHAKFEHSHPFQDGKRQSGKGEVVADRYLPGRSRRIHPSFGYARYTARVMKK